MGGVGRTGMVAACALVSGGRAAADAIARVRAVRHPTAVETAEQVAFVRAYEGHIATEGPSLGYGGDMNERWVCKRCFADNEASSGACVKCGLTRGAESSESDRAAWVAASPAGAPAERPGLAAVAALLVGAGPGRRAAGRVLRERPAR